MRIGPLQLDSPVVLAPIAGHCDLAFRMTVRAIPAADGSARKPAGLTWTDLLCPHAILRETEKTLWLAATHPDDTPVAMQLYGRHVDVLVEAARWAESRGAATVDINMGCPVDKVTKKNGGSMLLCEPQLAVDIAAAVVRAVRVPVTCKIRLGWDDGRLIVDSLPRQLADTGAAAVTVHGRTTEMRFKGECRISDIARVVECVKKSHPAVAVIGNGDVDSPETCKAMLDRTGCDGVMIGRAALGRPWIFRDCFHYLVHGVHAPQLPRADKARIVLQHFENLLHYRGERIAVNTMTQRIARYSADLQPWPGLRRDVRSLDSVTAFRDFMLAGIARIEEEELATDEHR